MSIIRAPRPDGNFYVLDKRISEDRTLSWGARGMLIFLLGKPDNWRVSIQNLVNETGLSKKKSGRDSVYAFLSELRESGYITLVQNRSESGAFGDSDYLVHEHQVPYTDSPDTAKPDAVIPDTGKPLTANTIQTNTDTYQSLKEYQIISTTTNNAELSEESSRKLLIQKLEEQFDISDTSSIADAELNSLKPVICQWVAFHPEKSVQDWLYYYAAAAKFEASRRKTIQRPSAFMQAIMNNPNQDWTQADKIREVVRTAKTRQALVDKRERELQAAVSQESEQMRESLAHFYELSSERQQEVLVKFRRENPMWSKYELSSKVLKPVLAKWFRLNMWDDENGELVENNTSPSESVAKQ